MIIDSRTKKTIKFWKRAQNFHFWMNKTTNKCDWLMKNLQILIIIDLLLLHVLIKSEQALHSDLFIKPEKNLDCCELALKIIANYVRSENKRLSFFIFQNSLLTMQCT